MEPTSSGRSRRLRPKQRSSAEFPHNERVRCPCRDDGGGEIVRFFARLDVGTAFATLIRQRHPMPSCGGLAPTAERTVDPARMIAESLTSHPGIREQTLTARDSCSAASPVDGLLEINELHTDSKTLSQPPPSTRGTHWRQLTPRLYRFLSCRSSGMMHGVP
jgi:hypothetical protein